MIIARLASGLGNQMFQYAAGLALAERHRTVLKLDVSSFGQVADAPAHERYSLHGLNIIEQFATRHEVDRIVGYRASQAPTTSSGSSGCLATKSRWRTVSS